MALMYCEECGGLVSDRATACPHCGCPVPHPSPEEKNDTPLYVVEEEDAPLFVLEEDDDADRYGEDYDEEEDDEIEEEDEIAEADDEIEVYSEDEIEEDNRNPDYYGSYSGNRISERGVRYAWIFIFLTVFLLLLILIAGHLLGRR